MRPLRGAPLRPLYLCVMDPKQLSVGRMGLRASRTVPYAVKRTVVKRR